MSHFSSQIDFHSQCDLLLEKFTELQTKMKLINKSSKIVVICGPTGSGKTTLLSRLISNRGPDEFHKEICGIYAGDERKAVNGADPLIGTNNSGSTTIVPNFHQVGELLVIDLAGFLDTNKELAPILTILNYHLFSQIRRFKLIMIFDSNNLANSGTFNQSMAIYANEMKNIFTLEHFGLFLSNTHFIFTKCDQVDFMKIMESLDLDVVFNKPLALEEKITRLIRSILSNWAPRQTGLSNFIVNRMIVNFKTIDYRTMDQRNVQHLMNITDSSSADINELHFNNVFKSNPLCETADVLIGNYAQAIEKHVADLAKYSGEYQSKTEIQESAVKKITKDLEDNIKSVVKYNNSLAKCKSDLKVLKEKNAEIPLQIEKLLSSQQGYSKVKEDLQTSISNRTYTELEIIRSLEVNREHKVGMVFEWPKTIKGLVNTFVIAANSYTSFQSEIHKIRNLDDFIHLNIAALKTDGIMEDKQKTTRLKLKNKSPFVVILIFERSYEESRSTIKYLEMINDDVIKAEEQLAKVKENGVLLSQKITQTETQIQKFESILQDCEKKDKDLNQQISKVEQEKSKTVKEMIFRINDAIKGVESIAKDSNYLSTITLNKILLESRVDVDRAEHSQIMDARIKDILSDLAAKKEMFEKLKN